MTTGRREAVSVTRAELEKLRPAPGDILVLRGMAPPGPDDPIDHAADPYYIVQQWMVDNSVTGVLVAALGEGQDARLWDAGQMAEAGWYQGQRAGAGVQAIAAERQQQTEQHGWSAEHDDEHLGGELGLAAYSYLVSYLGLASEGRPPAEWPWEEEAWRPTSPPEMLAKAGALIAAELDRRARAGYDAE